MSEWWVVIFLGVIAVSAAVQCAFVVMAARSLRSSGDRINDLCQRFDADIKPTLENLRHSSSNLRAISDSGREQAARIEALLSTTLESVETTVENVRSLVTRPMSTLSDLSAFWGGLRRGFETYRNVEPARRAKAAPARRSDESDEHLFIG